MCELWALYVSDTLSLEGALRELCKPGQIKDPPKEPRLGFPVRNITPSMRGSPGAALLLFPCENSFRGSFETLVLKIGLLYPVCAMPHGNARGHQTCTLHRDPFSWEAELPLGYC